MSLILSETVSSASKKGVGLGHCGLLVVLFGVFISLRVPCDAVKPCFYEDIPKLKLNGTAGFTNAEILELQKLNLKYNFEDGRYSPKPSKETEWKDKLVENLITIAKNTCDKRYVSRKFINIMKNLILIYIKNSEEKKTDTKTLNEWKQFNTLLKFCSDKTSNLTLEFTNAREVDGVDGPSFPEEPIDSDDYPDLDFIVDSLWFFFEASVGACYLYIEKTEWIVEYFFKFIDDIVGKILMSRWTYPNVGPPVKYGMFIGDVDMALELYNLRVCATYNHLRNGIHNRLILRPLYLDNLEGGRLMPNAPRTVNMLHPSKYLA